MTDENTEYKMIDQMVLALYLALERQKGPESDHYYFLNNIPEDSYAFLIQNWPEDFEKFFTPQLRFLRKRSINETNMVLQTFNETYRNAGKGPTVTDEEFLLMFNVVNTRGLNAKAIDLR